MIFKTNSVDVEFCFRFTGIGQTAEYSIELQEPAESLSLRAAGSLKVTQTQRENAFLISIEDIAEELKKQFDNLPIWGDNTDRDTRGYVLANTLECILEKAICNTLGSFWTPFDMWDKPEKYDPLWAKKATYFHNQLSQSGRKPLLDGVNAP